MGKAQLIGAVAKYFLKPGKSLLTHTKPDSMKNFSCVLQDGKLTKEAQASLGDASLFIEKVLELQHRTAKTEVHTIFENLSSVQTIQNRPKGALSIYTKLENGLKDSANQKFNNIQEAINRIEDGIGTRVITQSLQKLTNKDIDKIIATMKLEGKSLTAEESKLLKNYIYENPIEPSELDKGFRLFEEFARPLVESRSKEVVDQLTLGILKNRIIKGETTLEELKNTKLFNEDLIKRLSTEDVLPINITEINNYRGSHGLSEFSNNQIRQISRALGDNADVIIISDARSLKGRYSEETIAELSKKSIKKSGYRTAQINVVHKNGALGEIQFRGEKTNMIGEYEHIAYDIRKKKDTLGEVFDEFKTAIKSLSDDDYAIYNKYLEKCYNYYNRLELGLPAKRPELAKQFNKILSEESLKSLYEKDHKLAKELEKGFTRHFEVAA